MDILSFVKSRGSFSTLLMGAGTVFAGTAAAVIRGNMEVLVASICLIFTVFTQLGANYFHAYIGYTQYMRTLPPTRFKSSADPEKLLSQRVLKEAFSACFILSMMLGFALITLSQNPLRACLLGIVIYGLYALMSYGGKYLMGTFWGIITTFLLFGPIGVLGTCVLQTQHEAGPGLWGSFDMAPPIFLSFAIGFLAINVHLLYSYYTNKVTPGSTPNNMSSKLGNRTTIFLVILNGLIAFCTMTFKIFYLDYPSPLIASAPVFLGFALNTYIGIRMNRANVAELRFLTLLTKVNMFLTGFCIFIVWWVIGSPDDSLMRIF